MKVTVAISCYNQEDKITACMESVMAQDYDDIEILIVDDHSTDRSVEVINRMIESHPERIIRLLVHDTNKGITEVRNNSIREASGDSIFFVDGDDTMVENTLGLFCQQMEKKVKQLNQLIDRLKLKMLLKISFLKFKFTM